MLPEDSELKAGAGEGIEATRAGTQSQEEQAAAKSEEELKAAKEPVKEETFYEEGKVPDALKPSFKEMQKAFTQKTQEIANSKKRAEAFDTLMKDPYFQKVVSKRYLGESAEGAPAKEEGLTGAETGEFVDEDEAKMKKVTKRQDELEEEIEVIKEEGKLDKFAGSHPDLNKYLPEMYPLVQQGYTFVGAYNTVKFGKSETEAKKQMRDEVAKEMEAEKKAKVEGVGPSAGMLSPTEAKSVKEAYEQAKEAHKE